VDASYGIHSTGNSHTGVVILFGKGPVYCKSSKQHIVTKSSSESELVGLSDSSTPIIWSREFLIGQGYKMNAATVYEDNKSTIDMVKQGRSTNQRTRHINTRYYFIKDRIANGELSLVYKPTEDMIADLLTKPLQGDQFRKLKSLLCNLSM
jgi:hypothetical protein